MRGGVSLAVWIISASGLASGAIGLGLAFALVGWVGGTTLDIQVFGISTGILAALAGLWLLLAQPEPWRGGPALLWWALGPWLVVMSLLTLYIGVRTESPDEHR